MKFVLLDRIVAIDPPRAITTRKALSLAEEYLADHFPTFPVLPGVLMVEAMVQSAAWLVRASSDFACSMVVLAEAKNVTYKSFISPGRVLELRIQTVELEPTRSEFKGVGVCDDREMVKARFRLRHYNLAEQDAAMAPLDRDLTQKARGLYDLLGGPAAAAKADQAAIVSG